MQWLARDDDLVLHSAKVTREVSQDALLGLHKAGIKEKDVGMGKQLR